MPDEFRDGLGIEQLDDEEEMALAVRESSKVDEEAEAATEQDISDTQVGQDETEVPELPDKTQFAPATSPLVSRLPSVERATEKAGDIVWGRPKPEPPENPLEDLFAVPEEGDNDMYTDDLFEVDEEEIDMEDDLSDLTKISDEDIMGTPPRPRPPVRFARTSRRYNPPTSMGGIR